jgi:hypothetical protein
MNGWHASRRGRESRVDRQTLAGGKASHHQYFPCPASIIHGKHLPPNEFIQKLKLKIEPLARASKMLVRISGVWTLFTVRLIARYFLSPPGDGPGLAIKPLLSYLPVSSSF